MTTTNDRVTTSLGLFGLQGRSLRVLTTAATSYLGRLGSVLAVVVTIPIARAALPSDLFGVWMMLSGLVAFFAFADLGVGNGVLNRVTAAHAAGDHAEQRRVMRAGYACTGAMGILVLATWFGWAGIAIVPTAMVGPVVLDHRGEVLSALHAFFVLLAINIPASLVHKMQLGLQCGHWVGLTQTAAAVGTLVGVPAVLAFGGGLPELVLASLGMQVAANLASTWLWHRRLARKSESISLIQHRRHPELHMAVSLMRTGSLFLVLQLAAAFAFQSDSIVIVHQLGQSAYGDFAVVQRVFLAASSLILAGLSGLWPALGEALASGDAAWVRRAMLRSYMLVFVAMGATSILLAFSMPHLVLIWVGMQTPPPGALLSVLAAWTILEAMGNVSGAFLNAAGLLRVQVIFAALMGTAAFLGKWYLVGVLGAWGAVLATLIAYSVVSLPMQICLLRRYLRQDESIHA
jgi:O-antigen/teichoic acid export membrane protein